jgi:LPXTG-motif cell wall-anchored protein
VKLTESPTPAPTSAAASAQAAPETKSEQTSWFPWVGGAAVAGLLLGGVITLVRNRRKSA